MDFDKEKIIYQLIDKFEKNEINNADCIDIMIYKLINDIKNLYINEEELIIRKLLLKYISVLKKKII